MKAVHFGAGNIGRGFIGAILAEANVETIFVDVNKELIDELNKQQKYTIELAGTENRVEVTGVSGLHSVEDEETVVKEIAQADLITTAVGPNVLPMIAPLLAKALTAKDAQANVIACENMVGGSRLLKKYVLEQVSKETEAWIEENIGFPNAAVDRIVPDQHHADPLTVKVEPYFEWVVETEGMKGEQPKIDGITFVSDLNPYIERKLFTVNTGHAAAAYLGKYHGHVTIKQAMDDTNIKSKVRGALSETGAVLIEKHGFDKKTHEDYIDTILSRFENPDLSDEVTRVGRGPIRKLGPEDRLVKPALEYIELLKKEPSHLAEVVASALLYNNPLDEEAVDLQQRIANNGAITTFQDVAHLNSGHPFIEVVENHLNRMK